MLVGGTGALSTFPIGDAVDREYTTDFQNNIFTQQLVHSPKGEQTTI